MYHGDKEACGILTSGGTESILLAMLTYREIARERGIIYPEMYLKLLKNIYNY